jgi:hypothetical protein
MSLLLLFGGTPSTDRRGEISWSELEIPNAQRRGRVSWVEFEIPDVSRRARVSWEELELPDAPRRARVSWEELEAPNAPRRARVSWNELEAPEGARRARISWEELEVPALSTDKRALVSWNELEVPIGNRRAIVSWNELETPNPLRRALISWIEMELGAELEIQWFKRRITMRWFTLQFDFGAADTSKEVNFPQGVDAGLIRNTKVKIPDFSGTPTLTLEVYDSAMDKIYSKAAIPENAITLLNASTDVFHCVPGGKAKLTATGAPGSAMSCYVTFFIFE